MKENSRIIMNPALKKKLDMYSLVSDACENNKEVWENCNAFCQAFKQFKKFAKSNGIDIYKVDAILKYKLDRLIFQYKNSKRSFFQAYFKARIMAHLAL